MTPPIITTAQPETRSQPNTEVWLPNLPPTDLIFDDGEPLESNRHRIGMNVLIAAIHQAFAGRDDYFTGGNMFVYYSLKQVKNREFRGPDFFVTLDVDGNKERQGWVVWEEDGKYPDVIVELMSPTTAHIDLNNKKTLYSQTFHTQHYFVYDPFDAKSLQGWQLQGSQYQALQPNAQGQLWCAPLGLSLGVWQGTLQRETAPWLRFYDASGQLIPHPEELARQAQAEVEQERERADSAEERAKQASQEASQERERADRLAAKLRELGIEPD
ncbi:MAG: hypothetical protein F6J87_00830 [Spirulina sp. SIO3F2]|nr:hypothetical protein [Spirulina sp. SIO3F2]